MTFGEFLPARESVYLNPSAQVQGKPAGPAITQAKLGNGLDIVVIQDHRAPVVTHMVWYRNGSADDPPGKSGIAHFLEHLMFKGTKSIRKANFQSLSPMSAAKRMPLPQMTTPPISSASPRST